MIAKWILSVLLCAIALGERIENPSEAVCIATEDTEREVTDHQEKEELVCRPEERIYSLFTSPVPFVYDDPVSPQGGVADTYEVAHTFKENKPKTVAAKVAREELVCRPEERIYSLFTSPVLFGYDDPVSPQGGVADTSEVAHTLKENKPKTVAAKAARNIGTEQVVSSLVADALSLTEKEELVCRREERIYSLFTSPVLYVYDDPVSPKGGVADTSEVPHILKENKPKTVAAKAARNIGTEQVVSSLVTDALSLTGKEELVCRREERIYSLFTSPVLFVYDDPVSPQGGEAETSDVPHTLKENKPKTVAAKAARNIGTEQVVSSPRLSTEHVNYCCDFKLWVFYIMVLIFVATVIRKLARKYNERCMCIDRSPLSMEDRVFEVIIETHGDLPQPVEREKSLNLRDGEESCTNLIAVEVEK